MNAYEESGDYVFQATRPGGWLADQFSFYGPFSAGYELAVKRGQLYDATTITWTKH
jgi:hypothetical protein